MDETRTPDDLQPDPTLRPPDEFDKEIDRRVADRLRIQRPAVEPPTELDIRQTPDAFDRYVADIAAEHVRTRTYNENPEPEATSPDEVDKATSGTEEVTATEVPNESGEPLPTDETPADKPEGTTEPDAESEDETPALVREFNPYLLQLQSAITANPDDAGAHHVYAHALVDVGRPEEAIGHFRISVRLQPDNADYHACLALTALLLGRLSEAESQIEEALRLDRGNPLFASVAGRIREAGRNEPDEPRSALMGENDDLFTPDFVDMLADVDGGPPAELENALGVFIATSGDPEVAMSHFRRATKLAPDVFEYWVLLATTANKVGRQAEAFEALGKARGLLGIADSADATANERIAELEQQLADSLERERSLVCQLANLAQANLAFATTSLKGSFVTRVLWPVLVVVGLVTTVAVAVSYFR